MDNENRPRPPRTDARNEQNDEAESNRTQNLQNLLQLNVQLTNAFLKNSIKEFLNIQTMITHNIIPRGHSVETIGLQYLQTGEQLINRISYHLEVVRSNLSEEFQNAASSSVAGGIRQNMNLAPNIKDESPAQLDSVVDSTCPVSPKFSGPVSSNKSQVFPRIEEIAMESEHLDFPEASNQIVTTQNPENRNLGQAGFDDLANSVEVEQATESEPPANEIEAEVFVPTGSSRLADTGRISTRNEEVDTPEILYASSSLLDLNTSKNSRLNFPNDSPTPTDSNLEVNIVCPKVGGVTSADHNYDVCKTLDSSPEATPLLQISQGAPESQQGNDCIDLRYYSDEDVVSRNSCLEPEAPDFMDSPKDDEGPVRELGQVKYTEGKILENDVVNTEVNNVIIADITVILAEPSDQREPTQTEARVENAPEKFLSTLPESTVVDEEIAPISPSSSYYESISSEEDNTHNIMLETPASLQTEQNPNTVSTFEPIAEVLVELTAPNSPADDVEANAVSIPKAEGRTVDILQNDMRDCVVLLQHLNPVDENAAWKKRKAYFKSVFQDDSSTETEESDIDTEAGQFQQQDSDLESVETTTQELVDPSLQKTQQSTLRSNGSQKKKPRVHIYKYLDDLRSRLIEALTEFETFEREGCSEEDLTLACRQLEEDEIERQRELRLYEKALAKATLQKDAGMSIMANSNIRQPAEDEEENENKPERQSNNVREFLKRLEANELVTSSEDDDEKNEESTGEDDSGFDRLRDSVIPVCNAPIQEDLHPVEPSQPSMEFDIGEENEESESEKDLSDVTDEEGEISSNNSDDEPGVERLKKSTNDSQKKKQMKKRRAPTTSTLFTNARALEAEFAELEVISEASSDDDNTDSIRSSRDEPERPIQSEDEKEIESRQTKKDLPEANMSSSSVGRNSTFQSISPVNIDQGNVTPTRREQSQRPSSKKRSREPLPKKYVSEEETFPVFDISSDSESEGVEQWSNLNKKQSPLEITVDDDDDDIQVVENQSDVTLVKKVGAQTSSGKKREKLNDNEPIVVEILDSGSPSSISTHMPTDSDNSDADSDGIGSPKPKRAKQSVKVGDTEEENINSLSAFENSDDEFSMENVEDQMEPTDLSPENKEDQMAAVPIDLPLENMEDQMTALPVDLPPENMEDQMALEPLDLSAPELLTRNVKQQASSQVSGSSTAHSNTPNSQESLTPFSSTSNRKEKGRKTIRPIIEVETVEAKEEAKRFKFQEKELERLIEMNKGSLRLKFSDDPLIEVDLSIASKLKQHQREGILFLWLRCFGLQTLNESGNGGILSHCMGLGKTVQALAFLHTVLTHAVFKIKYCVVLCPLNIVSNWEAESKTWFAHVNNEVNFYNISGTRQPGSDADKLKVVKQYKKTGGIALIHYELFRAFMVESESNDTAGSNSATGVAEANGATASNSCAAGMTSSNPSRTFVRDQLTYRAKKVFKKTQILVCDEGHMLKNGDTSIHKVIHEINTKRKLLLTGTVMQNNPKEFYYLINLVQPVLLGELKRFANNFIHPITNGQYGDSNKEDIDLSKARELLLHEKTKNVVHRRTNSLLQTLIPSKFEFGVVLNLTDVQKRLYYKFEEIMRSRDADIAKGRLLFDFSIVQNFCCHPALLSESFTFSTSSKTGERKPVESNTAGGIADERINALIAMISDEEKERMTSSSKLIALQQIVQGTIDIGEKLLIFSRYRKTLNIIEHFMTKDAFGWGKLVYGKDYYRIDGTTRSDVRYTYCCDFNKSERAKLFLITTKTGGVGVNLAGANRVVLMDISMNPADDEQSMFRVYRLGQTKPCFIYRLICRGGMEEKNYNRAVIKLRMGRRIIDQKNSARNVNLGNTSNMYEFNPDSIPISTVDPSKEIIDPVLKRLLEQSNLVNSYMDHETLLQDSLAEHLNDEEKEVVRKEGIQEKVEQPKSRGRPKGSKSQKKVKGADPQQPSTSGSKPSDQITQSQTANSEPELDDNGRLGTPFSSLPSGRGRVNSTGSNRVQFTAATNPILTQLLTYEEADLFTRLELQGVTLTPIPQPTNQIPVVDSQSRSVAQSQYGYFHDRFTFDSNPILPEVMPMAPSQAYPTFNPGDRFYSPFTGTILPTEMSQPRLPM